MTGTILLYQDRGVSLLGKTIVQDSIVYTLKELGLDLEVRSVMASDLDTRGIFSDSSLFVLPGGMDLPYCEDLNGSRNENLKSFVREGGSFLGICAGAYYASGEIIFNLNGPMEVRGERELKFFSGRAVGPAYGPGCYTAFSDEGAKAATIHWTDEFDANCKIYFNGGCYFTGLKGPDVTVLAQYAELEKSPPAIIKCRYGHGSVVLCGVHPEYSVGMLPRDPTAPPGLYQDLEANDHMRLEILKSIMRILL